MILKVATKLLQHYISGDNLHLRKLSTVFGNIFRTFNQTPLSSHPQLSLITEAQMLLQNRSMLKSRRLGLLPEACLLKFIFLSICSSITLTLSITVWPQSRVIARAIWDSILLQCRRASSVYSNNVLLPTDNQRSLSVKPNQCIVVSGLQRESVIIEAVAISTGPLFLYHAPALELWITVPRIADHHLRTEGKSDRDAGTALGGSTNTLIAPDVPPHCQDARCIPPWNP